MARFNGPGRAVALMFDLLPANSDGPALPLAQEHQGGSHLDATSLLREGSEETLPQTLHRRDEAWDPLVEPEIIPSFGEGLGKEGEYLCLRLVYATTSAMK
jgi:hypothetical protein